MEMTLQPLTSAIPFTSIGVAEAGCPLMSSISHASALPMSSAATDAGVEGRRLQHRPHLLLHRDVDILQPQGVARLP